jgi:hypothetical protein
MDIKDLEPEYQEKYKELTEQWYRDVRPVLHEGSVWHEVWSSTKVERIFKTYSEAELYIKGEHTRYNEKCLGLCIDAQRVDALAPLPWYLQPALALIGGAVVFGLACTGLVVLVQYIRAL